MTKKKVIQWATGHVGQGTLRAIIGHPDLELVGVRVYGAEKDGVDAGSLCGLGDVGVLATTDVEALLALSADCVCYTALESAGIDAVTEDMCRILSSGTNLVGSTLLPLIYPAGVSPLLTDAVRQLETAAQQGGSTLYVSGVNPGCLLDVIPPLLVSGCIDIDCIRVVEHYSDISWYQDGSLGRELFGLSLTPEEFEATQELRLMIMAEYFGCALKLLAHGLGGDLTGLVTSLSPVSTKEAFDLNGLHVGEGTVGACHARLEGRVGATKLIYDEFVSGSPLVHCPDWPSAPGGGGGYRIDVSATPEVNLSLTFGRDGPLAMADAFAFTSNRLVNSIPTVCAAPAGLMPVLSIARNVVGRPKFDTSYAE